MNNNANHNKKFNNSNRNLNPFILCEVHLANGSYTTETYSIPNSTIAANSGKSYKIGKMICRGNNGTIFSCKSIENENMAVKFMHKLGEKPLKRFMFELSVLRKFDSEHIIPCYDDGEFQDPYSQRKIPFFITKHYDGNLEGEVERFGRLNKDRFKAVALEILSAFEEIHSRGYIHRDIKPQNFFVSGESIVIGDFGIAKTSQEEGIDRFVIDGLSSTGEFVGPIFWVSPELMAYHKDKRTPVDHRSDIFQIGLVLWWIATGTNYIGNIDPEDDGYDGRLYSLLSRALKSNRERRYKSVSEFADLMKDF